MMYKNICDSINYYRSKGFIYTEVPWIVDKDVSAITKPEDKNDFFVKDKTLVGSGEQSFLQMIEDNQLKPGSYVCVTPCFRDEEEDETHKTYFLKTELIDTLNPTPNRLYEIINIAKQFYSEYVEVEVVKIHEGSYDIVDKNSGIELGSYSLKKYQNLVWICGTGCAEPRLSLCYRKSKPTGYHESIIPKRVCGTYRKILEEVDEFEDAILSNNTVMALVELSDILGAIELYLKANHPSISLNDLIKMSFLTHRAFLSGRRKKDEGKADTKNIEHD